MSQRQFATLHIYDPASNTYRSQPLRGRNSECVAQQLKPGGKRIEISDEELVKYSHLRQEEAALKLGVSLSTYKRRFS